MSVHLSALWRLAQSLPEACASHGPPSVLPRWLFHKPWRRGSRCSWLQGVWRPAAQGGRIQLGGCERCGAVRGGDAHGTGWAGGQEDNPTAMARFAWWCQGSFGRGGCLEPGGFRRQGRRGSSARSPACQGVLLLAEGAREASLERARQRRWPHAVGCRGKSAAPPAAMTAALTLPGSAERGTRWRVQTKPGPRAGGRAAEHCQGPALGMTPESGRRGRKSESEPRAG